MRRRAAVVLHARGVLGGARPRVVGPVDRELAEGDLDDLPAAAAQLEGRLERQTPNVTSPSCAIIQPLLDWLRAMHVVVGSASALCA